MAHTFSDTIFFHEGGLNWDDDIITLLPGDGRIRRNVSTSDDGNFNVFTNLLGNTLQATSVGGGGFSYPLGTLKVINFVEDKENKAGIFFVHSSVGEHSIIRFFSETNELDYIIDGSSGSNGTILNFPSTGYIDSALIGNEDDLQIVWVGGDNDPRMAPVTGVSSVDEKLIKVYREPLMEKIRVFETVSLTGDRNNLRGHIFQFAIRRKFDDNTLSVLSYFTEPFIPSEDEFADGLFVSNVRKNSLLTIDFPIVGSPEEFQICYRILDVGSGAPSDWYVSGVDGYTSAPDIRFRFNYDETGILIPPSLANKIYDYVPDRADRVETIDSNRIVFGGVTEGYNNLNFSDIDVTFNELTPAMTSSVQSTSDTNNIASAASYNFNTDKSTSDDFYYKLILVGGIDGFIDTVVYSGSYGITETEVRDSFISVINSKFSTLTISAAIVDSNTFSITNSLTTSQTLYAGFFVLSGSEKKGSFKLGSKLFFGLQYFKNGKPWFVQSNTDPDTSVNPLVYDVPNASDLIGTHTELDYYYNLEWEIDHLPPQEATHWQWCYLGDNIDYHEAFLVNNQDDLTHDGNYTIINKNIISRFRQAYGDDINYGFDIQKGDRVRFVGEFNSTFTAYTVVMLKDEITVLDEDFVLDLEILAVTSTEIKIRNIEGTALYNASSTDDFYVQIYRYKQINLDSGIFQAVSPMYEIYESGGTKYHEGPTQNQTALVPATGTFNPYFSNCFISYQVFLNENNIEAGDQTYAQSIYGFMENHNVSILYDSNIQQYGKPNIINPYAEQRKWNKLRYGNKYLDESGINFVRSFDFNGERFLDDRNGIVIRLQQIGDTLKAYQERKITSFYLKTLSGTGASGEQVYVFQDNVMSEGRQSVSDFGCTHYASYIKTVREAYFFDIINGAVLKDTPGGIIPISDFKMHTYFKNKARDIIAYGAEKVLISGGWDEDLNLYMITFYIPTDTGHAINETVAFYERIDRWVTFCDFVPELYGKISGDTALTFYEGELYTQNTNTIRNNFFGDQYESVVDVVSKGNPSVIKVFESIEVMSTGEWAPSSDGDIEIEIPELMQSRLLKGRFKRQEGVYLSDLLRDALDGTGSFIRDRLHNGRFLRGYEIRVRFRNDDTEEAQIRLVKVNSKISQ